MIPEDQNNVFDVRVLSWNINDGEGSIAFDDDAIYRELPRFFGQPKIANWHPLRAYALGGQPMDFMFVRPGVFACSCRAMSVISKIISNEVEFLPIRLGDALYHIMNIVNVIDALKIEEPILEFSAYQDGRLPSCPHLAFDTNVVNGAVLFKVPQLIESHIFANGQFVETIRDNDLHGLNFVTALHVKLIVTDIKLRDLIDLVRSTLEKAEQTICIDIDTTMSDISYGDICEFIPIAGEWAHPMLESIRVQGKSYTENSILF